MFFFSFSSVSSDRMADHRDVVSWKYMSNCKNYVDNVSDRVAITTVIIKGLPFSYHALY